MKKIVFLLLLIAAALVITACAAGATDIASAAASSESAASSAPESSAAASSAAASSAPESSSTVSAVADTAVTEMSALAKELLTDFSLAKTDARIAFSTGGGTTRLSLVTDFVEAVKRGERTGFTGLLIGDPVPVVYEADYQPGGGICLTTYFPRGKQEPEVRKTVITDIYETELFYQLSNRSGTYFSIPRVSMHDIVPMEDYKADSDLQNMPITAAQAKEAAKNAYTQIYGYLGYLDETDGGNPINGYGVVIPPDFSAEPADMNRFTFVAEGAAAILGKPHYLISFYEGGEFSGESYYVDAEKAETIFIVSMVDGGIIPVSCQNAVHFPVN